MIKFSEIKDTNHKDFIEAIKIYRGSFPSNERQPVDKIKKRVKENLYRMFIGRLDDKVIFMALLYPLENTDFILFDYMATDKDFRNKGVGTKFINNILREIAPKYLILEVEDPSYGNNKEQRARRVKFYKSLGARVMENTRYIMPPLSGNIPTEMTLMVLPKYCKGKIDGGLVKRLVAQIYKELYNRDEDDDLLNSFVNDIKNTIRLV